MASGQRPRVFLDTNVFYSAIHSPGSVPAQLLAAHAGGEIRTVVSELVLVELVQTVRNKIPSAVERVWAVLRAAPPEVVPDPPGREVEAVADIVNFKDAPIAAAARLAQVDYFVTGDSRFAREFSELPGSPTCLTPRQLLERLSGNPPLSPQTGAA